MKSEEKLERKNPIELEFDEKTYILDYTRESIVWAEKHGFSLSEDFGKAPFTDMVNLFCFAFRAHHPEVTREKAESILFDDLGGISNEMISRLSELYAAQYNTLFGGDKAGKNGKVKVRM